MVTGAHVPELTGSGCNSHTFVFMPSARMLSRAVTPHLVKTFGNRWFMVTAETMDSRAAEQAMSEALQTEGGEVLGSVSTPFGTTDFTTTLAQAKTAKPSAVILNLYGWDLVHALRAYTAAGLAQAHIGVGGMIGGEQIGRPLGYANNAGIWGLIWDPKVQSESSRRFIQGVIEKYHHTPTSRCYHGYAAMTQILEAVQRAGTTDTQAVIKALEGHEFDGLKEGRSYFRGSDHQHVQDVLVGKAYGKELGLGHYQLLATVPGDAVVGSHEEKTCTR
jgi:branched-chain amino acid transport system substrate-binding protein